MAERAATMRVGIAGLGVASNLVMPELSAHPHVKIVAGADPRVAARERFVSEYGGPAYETVEGLCADPGVDVVYILTPNRFHANHAIIAAEHGKQVVLDKPMAIKLDDADRVIAAGEKNGVRILAGHSQSLDPSIRRMADLIASGEMGRRVMIQSQFYSDWLYRPRSADELDLANGEGLTMRQGPVQVDIARMLGGGVVRSVRAQTSALDSTRPIDGSFMAFLEFEDGTPATLIYSAYGYFNSVELTYGIDLQGYAGDLSLHAKTHERFRAFGNVEAEWAFKESTRYGSNRPRAAAGSSPAPEKRHAFFGFTLASCELGDIRQTPTGLAIDGKQGRREVAVDAGPDYEHRYTTAEMDIMWAAWSTDRPLAHHDATWAKGTLEVCLAIHASARQREELRMSHQVPYAPRYAV